MVNIAKLILVKGSSQHLILPRITKNNLPTPVMKIIETQDFLQPKKIKKTQTKKENKKIKEEDTIPLEERWVIIRYCTDGQIAFFLTKGFERNICSYERLHNSVVAKKSKYHELWQQKGEILRAKGLGLLVCQVEKLSCEFLCPLSLDFEIPLILKSTFFFLFFNRRTTRIMFHENTSNNSIR